MAMARKRPRVISSELANLAPMTINRIGDDLLVEILIRGLRNLRSAFRCKLICKRWSSLISGPRFNRRFVSHHSNMNHPPLMPTDPYKLQSIISSFIPMAKAAPKALRVLDYNKDLVLCRFYESIDVKPRSSYLVCNPFTKQWIALPPMKRTSLSEDARLVCEPRISKNLDLGDGQVFACSEYRFRVVRMYKVNNIPAAVALRLDLFCSESGEWTNKALVCHDHDYYEFDFPVSCDGELFWKYYERRNQVGIFVARFNPFRLDMPPVSIDASAFLGKPNLFLSSSQGALHVIALENTIAPIRLSLWRLEEDGKYWRKLQGEGLLSKTSKNCNYQVKDHIYLYLHPHNPGIIFFHCNVSDKKYAILCYDLRREELDFFGELKKNLPHVLDPRVFQPRVSCWRTPIPEVEGKTPPLIAWIRL